MDNADNTITCKIVFRGEILSGFEPSLVKQNCMSLLKINEEQMERFFSGRDIILRKGVESEDVSRFLSVFHQNGLRVYVIEEADIEALKLEPVQKVKKERWKPGPVKVKGQTQISRYFLAKSEFIKVIRFLDVFVQGRCGWRAFVNTQLMVLLVLVAINILLVSVRKITDYTLICDILMYLSSLICYFAILYRAIPRLHDINLSGTWILLHPATVFAVWFFNQQTWSVLLCALISIAFLAILLFMPGSEGENFYGEPATDDVLEKEEIVTSAQQIDEPRQPVTRMFTRYFLSESTQKNENVRAQTYNTTFFLDYFISGRLSRSIYSYWFIVIGLSVTCFSLSLKTVEGSPVIVMMINLFVFLLIFSAYLVLCYYAIMRLHDANLSGVWVFVGISAVLFVYLLMMIPGINQYVSELKLRLFALVVNMVFYIFLCVVPGIEQTNRFGGAPVTQINRTGVPQFVFLGVPVFLFFVTIMILVFILKNPVLRGYVF